jgi:three-Cys-motif partner protein
VAQDRLFSTEEFDREYRRLVLSRPKRSVDEAREFYGWTAHKLEIFDLYLKLYRRVAGGGTYIDGFAGDGRIGIDGQERPGSVARALDAGAFKQLRLYERPRTAKRLRVWVDQHSTVLQRSRTHVSPGDFNELVIGDLDPKVIPLNKACFAFLDPNSTQLNWTTVEALARYKADCSPPDTCKIELWILLSTYHALPRLIPRNSAHLQVDTLNRWLGGETGWRDLYEGNRRPHWYAERFAERLMSEFGYGLARSITIRDPKSGRPQYHMVHASDHPAAHDFMRWAASHAHPKDSEAIPLPGIADNE